jgi:hypothetical protein
MVFSSNEFNLKVIICTYYYKFCYAVRLPAFTRRKSEVINGTGNAVVPEGTKVSWRINAESTQKIELLVANSSLDFRKRGDSFFFK